MPSQKTRLTSSTGIMSRNTEDRLEGTTRRMRLGVRGSSRANAIGRPAWSLDVVYEQRAWRYSRSSLTVRRANSNSIVVVVPAALEVRGIASDLVSLQRDFARCLRHTHIVELSKACVESVLALRNVLCTLRAVRRPHPVKSLFFASAWSSREYWSRDRNS